MTTWMMKNCIGVKNECHQRRGANQYSTTFRFLIVQKKILFDEWILGIDYSLDAAIDGSSIKNWVLIDIR